MERVNHGYKMKMNRKEKRKHVKWFFIFGIFMFLISGVSAKFVCGEVYYQGQITPSWYDVKAYLYSNSSIYSECKVSPDDYKYCCELDSLKDFFGYEWGIGDLFFAEIIDYDFGLMAGPTSVVLSGEGYDIMAPMELREVVQIMQPENKLIINNESNFIFEANVFDDCDFGIMSNGSKKVLCEEGCDYLEKFDVNYGLSEIEFFSECGENNFSKNISLYVVEDVEFESSLGNKIKKDEKTNVFLSGEISGSVSELEFREYVPVEFEISGVSDSGYVEFSSSNYNVIVWEVNGASFDFSYSISSGVVGDYYFVSEFEGNILEENFVNLYNYVSSGGGGSSISGGSTGIKYEPENFSMVTDTLPLICKKDNLTLAIYSENFTERGAAELFGLNFSSRIYNRSLRFFDGYSVEMNLGNNFGKFAFEYDFNEIDLGEKGYAGLKFYGKDSRGKWNSLTGNFVKMDDDIKFEFEGEEFFREIVIFGVKDKLSFWDRVFQKFWDLFGFKTRVF